MDELQTKKCKVLTYGHYYFVCMPDGTKIPLQISLLMSQGKELRDECDVTFVAYFGAKAVDGLDLTAKDSVVYLGRDEIPGVVSFEILPPADGEEQKRIKVNLICDLAPTEEKAHGKTPTALI